MRPARRVPPTHRNRCPSTQGPQSPDRDDPSSVSADSSCTTDAGPRARAARALQTSAIAATMRWRRRTWSPTTRWRRLHVIARAREEDTPGADARDDSSDVVPRARAHAAARGERRRVLRGRGRAHARDPIPAMDTEGTAARDDSPHAPCDGAVDNAGVSRRSTRAAGGVRRPATTRTRPAGNCGTNRDLVRRTPPRRRRLSSKGRVNPWTVP